MNLDSFISKYVIKREQSMFVKDLDNNLDALSSRIKGKSVLVIGGAGSIGSSFVSAVIKYLPKTLVVVDINENALTELTRNLRSTKGVVVPKDYVTYPMDYYSPVFEKMFRKRKGFDIVANFSAHKHVRSEKDIYSVESLIRNNVLNVRKLLDLLVEFPPEEYFCVSTDKAANPVNIMGASKRLMEDLIFSYSDHFKVTTARFANVAFSNGSLLAGFLARMSKLQPLSAPTDIKRYFVSPEESGQICLLACILGNNREIFFPKLKEAQMLGFDQICRDLVRENNYKLVECNSEAEAIDKAELLKNGGNEYPVYFSKSDTSGEKAYEEFYVDGELFDLNKYNALGVITNKEIPNKDKLTTLFEKLDKAFASENVNKDMIVNIIKEYLPNFQHIETKKSLDSKM